MRPQAEQVEQQQDVVTKSLFLQLRHCSGVFIFRLCNKPTKQKT